jgi:hypothetical protein
MLYVGSLWRHLAAGLYANKPKRVVASDQ